MEPNIYIQIKLSGTSDLSYDEAVRRFRALEEYARETFPECKVLGTWEPVSEYRHAAA